MPAFRHRIRALAVGVGAFALVAVAAGGTFAASNPATLYACYDAYGNVRMGDTAQCKLPGGGRLVNWSTAGIPGPTGPTGATGPTGPTGPAGATGAGSVAHIVTVPGDGLPHYFYTSPAFNVGLTCGGSFVRGVAVSVPAGAAEPVLRMRMTYDGFLDSFANSAGTVAIGGNLFFSAGEWVDLQLANSTAGLHVTAAWTSGAAPDTCTFLVSW
ncbi:MAG: hypothetical protein MUE82_12185 [Chloroflexi bacterium]|nr:hypothetical protein [Chloroflexota bacterium]